MLDVERLALCRDSLLDRDDVHSDTVAALAYHLCDACKRQISHTLKEVRDLRCVRHDLVSHDHDLRSARYEHVEHVTSLMLRILAVLVLVVPLDETELAQSLQDCLQMIVIVTRQLFHLRESLRLTLAHLESSIQTILCDVLAVSPDDVLISAVESPVFRRILGRLLKSEEDLFTVSDDLRELEDLLVVAQLFSLFCHTFPSLSLTITFL